MDLVGHFLLLWKYGKASSRHNGAVGDTLSR
jgi:hypothetical protein